MKKLDLYLIKAFVGPFVAILLFVVFALAMQFLWLYIDELVGKGLGVRVVLEFMGWGAAIMLPLSLPLATVLSSVMTMGNMAENFELTATKAAGISLGRVMAPLIAVNIVIAGIGFYVANNLVPTAYNNIYSLRSDILNTKQEISIPTLTFYDGIDGYILRVEQNDKKTGMMRKVMVYNHTTNNGNVSLALADSAIMKMSENKKFINFTMYNGINYEETNSQRGRDTTRQVQRTEFSSQEMIIPIENYGFEKSEVGRYSDQAKSMQLGELVMDRDSLAQILDTRRGEKVAEMRTNTFLQYNRQLDTAKFNQDAAAFPLDSLRITESLAKQISEHENAINRLNSYISDMTAFERETYDANVTIKLVAIEIYKKFSLSIVCFLLFFIGAPLGALIRKGGLGTPAIISVLFFVLYYIVDIVGTKLARDGAIGPMSGVFISAYVLLPIGAYFTYKAVRDESILSTDNLANQLKRIKAFIMERFHKTRIVYMGTPEFAVAPLQALLDQGYKVSAVVTVPDKPAGRGMGVSESAVKKFAVSKGIPVLQPEKMKDPEFIETLKKIKADMFVVVAFRLLPREVWSIPRLGTFNLHAALLPQYRGAAPINWAVINGEKATGVTSFLIDDGVDTGTILIREQHKIQPADTAGDVHDALMEMGSRVVVQTVQGLIEGSMDPRVQKSFIQGEEVLHKAPKLTRELCHIDWNDKAESIVNLIRGLSDYPAAFTNLVSTQEDGKTLSMKIFRASASDRPAGQVEPGTIVSDGRSYLAVAAADRLVMLDEIQLSGKKRMKAEDFLRGFHNPETFKADAGTSAAIIAEVHRSERE